MPNLMSGSLLSLLSAFFLVLSNTFKKTFKKDCEVFYAFVCCIFADLVFVAISGFKFDFNLEVLPYAILYAISYSTCTLFSLKAYKSGNFSIVSLIISYSLILPTLYGIIILKEKTSSFFYIGLVLLFISIYIINMKKSKTEEGKTEKNKNKLWIIFLALAFLGNGFCSVFHTAEQTAFNGKYKNELMIISLSLSAIVFLIVSLISEKDKIRDGGIQAFKCASLSGISNGLLNLCILYSLNLINSSIVFPEVSGVSLLFTFIIGALLFKEKHSLLQYIGFGISIISVVLLNL